VDPRAPDLITHTLADIGDVPGNVENRRAALLASGQIAMRKVDGWRSLAEKPSDQIIDLAA
jgi:hypothetical protein